MRKMTVLILLVFTATFAFSQKTFEGKLDFEINLLGDAGMMAAFMPSGYTYYFQGSDILFKMNGGMAATMMGEILMNGNDGVGYMIKHGEKTAYKIEADEGDSKSTGGAPEITRENETLDILGYKCQKYKVKIQAEGMDVVQYMWVTSELKLKKPKSSEKMPSGNNLFIEGLEGFPLKVVSDIPMANAKMEMIAVQISEESLAKGMFIVPPDYKIEKLDPKSLMGF